MGKPISLQIIIIVVFHLPMRQTTLSLGGLAWPINTLKIGSPT